MPSGTELFEDCEVVFLSWEDADEFPAEVRISADEIVVTYYEEGQDRARVWRGRRDRQGNFDSGHYALSLEAGDGRATLHRFKGGALLEGFLQEGGVEGMWRIRLR